MQKTLFISDLHLNPAEPAITAKFLQFLNDCDQSVSALYILGDLFDTWIGDDEQSTFQKEIIQGLKNATQNGLPIYFLYGNHDFLIGKQFLKQTGCQLIADEEKIFLYGTPVLLMHGDSLCTQDIQYLKARKLTRNVFLQKLFLLLPLSFRKKVAEKMHAKSHQHTSRVAMDIMDVTEDAVSAVMQKHEVLHLIHGHTHKPGQHELRLAGQKATRLVLGAWHAMGNQLIWYESGKKEMLEW